MDVEVDGSGESEYVSGVVEFSVMVESVSVEDDLDLNFERRPMVVVVAVRCQFYWAG